MSYPKGKTTRHLLLVRAVALPPRRAHLGGEDPRQRPDPPRIPVAPADGACPDTDAHAKPDTDTDADRDADADANANTDAHANADPDAHANADPDGDVKQPLLSHRRAASRAPSPAAPSRRSDRVASAVTARGTGRGMRANAPYRHAGNYPTLAGETIHRTTRHRAHSPRRTRPDESPKQDRRHLRIVRNHPGR